MDDDKEQPTTEAQTPAPEAENGNDTPQPETPADDNGGGESTADTDRLADIENRLTALELWPSICWTGTRTTTPTTTVRRTARTTTRTA